jgi:serine/threonine-protein kinase RsbW
MQTLTLTANLDALAQITAFITAAAEHLGLDERATWQVQLAVDEAATNIIQYAYDAEHPGDIVVTWYAEDDRLVIRLCDHGRRFDPQAVEPPNLELPLEERQVGGLGIYLMTRLMDEVRFDFDPQAGNLLTLVKQLTNETQTEVTLLPLQGRIDAVTSPQMSAEVRARIDAGARYLLLDLSAVPFMSSSGLRALLLIRKDLMMLGGEVRLAALQPQVREVFDITGFAQVFAIHATVEEARDAFGQGRA